MSEVVAAVPDNMHVAVGQIVVFWFHQASVTTNKVLTAMAVKMKDVHAIGSWKLQVGNTEGISAQGVYTMFKLHSPSAECSSSGFDPANRTGAIWVYPFPGDAPHCYIDRVLFPNVVQVSRLDPMPEFSRVVVTAPDDEVAVTQHKRKKMAVENNKGAMQSLLEFCNQPGLSFGAGCILVICEAIHTIRKYYHFCNTDGADSEYDINIGSGMPLRCGPFVVTETDDIFAQICLAHVAHCYMAARPLLVYNNGIQFPLQRFVGVLIEQLLVLERTWAPLHTSEEFSRAFVGIFIRCVSATTQGILGLYIKDVVSTRNDTLTKKILGRLRNIVGAYTQNMTAKDGSVDIDTNAAMICDNSNQCSLQSDADTINRLTLHGHITVQDIMCFPKIKVNASFLPVIPFGAQCSGHNFVNAVRGTPSFGTSNTENQLNRAFLDDATRRINIECAGVDVSVNTIFQMLREYVMFSKKGKR